MNRGFLTFLLAGIFSCNPCLWAWDSLSFSRVGGTHAEIEGSHSASINPSLLPTKPLGSIQLSTFQTRLNISDTSPDTSQRNASLQSNFLRWALSFEQPFLVRPLKRKIGFGLSLTAPFDKVARFQAIAKGDSLIPRYGLRDQQFKSSAGLGIEVIPEKLYFGTSLSFFLNSLGSAEMLLSESPSSRMNVDVAIQAAPVIGLFSQLGSVSTALVFREKIDPLLDQSVNARLQLNDKDAFEQPFLLKTYLYFEPKTLDWDLQTELSGPINFSLGASYEFWQDYESPLLLTETFSSEGEVYRTKALPLNTSNTFNPRTSLTWRMGQLSLLNMGYQFRPSPFQQSSNRENSLNVIDSPTHVLGLGFNQRFINDIPWDLGVFTQWHRMTDPSSQGGNIWVFGISAKLG